MANPDDEYRGNERREGNRLILDEIHQLRLEVAELRKQVATIPETHRDISRIKRMIDGVPDEGLKGMRQDLAEVKAVLNAEVEKNQTIANKTDGMIITLRLIGGLLGGGAIVAIANFGASLVN